VVSGESDNGSAVAERAFTFANSLDRISTCGTRTWLHDEKSLAFALAIALTLAICS